jgi:hypothetical protein
VVRIPKQATETQLTRLTHHRFDPALFILKSSEKQDCPAFCFEIVREAGLSRFLL